jgi:hypothetical protein
MAKRKKTWTYFPFIDKLYGKRDGKYCRQGIFLARKLLKKDFQFMEALSNSKH